jgi:hypothetical protein
MIPLPFDCSQIVYSYLPFEEVLRYTQDERILKTVYNPLIHTWGWATHNGYLEALIWLRRRHKRGCKPRMVVKCALESGRRDILQWIYQYKQPTWPEQIKFLIDFAIGVEDLDFVQFLHTIGAECTANAMNFAAQYGHLEVIKWLHFNRTEGVLQTRWTGLPIVAVLK